MTSDISCDSNPLTHFHYRDEYIIYWISMDMEIRLKLRKVGNSLMIAIPSQIVKDLKLKAGDDMLLDIIDSTISVKKERRQKNY